MDKQNLDLSALPEPLKSMLQNVDMNTLEQLKNNLDPAALTALLRSTMSMMQQSLKPEDAQALNNLMNTVMQLVENKKR